jgi:hypothetical protein
MDFDEDMHLAATTNDLEVGWLLFFVVVVVLIHVATTIVARNRI